MSEKNTGWIAVDLDGTLAVYDHWRGIEHIGEPILPMVERVKRWIKNGADVRIFTARVGDQNGEAHRDIDAVRSHIEVWCIRHIGTALPITNVKDHGMIELWDDRCVRVELNTGRVIGGQP